MSSLDSSATHAQPDTSGLDFDFLRYIGTEPASQRRIQSFYLPLFAGCRHVVDLGCGDGDFVTLLLEEGVEVVGVDADDKVQAAAQAKGLPLIHRNVFDYLANAPDQSVDGIFCAHLVEHLAYPQVMELVRQAYRILRPGGRIVLATPDCRTLFSHLEMFYLHFGHISFYHPRLLCFLLTHEGFDGVEFGVNPHTASPLLPHAHALSTRGPLAPPPARGLAYRRTIPLQGKSWLHRLSFALKRRLAAWLVLPFVDSLAAGVDVRLGEADPRLTLLDEDLRRLAADLDAANGPFECYATALKPPDPVLPTP
jgi:SAM-dependent methyltransferase